ncbi:MAG: 2Fe-2S iron-sulfur cluster-binding protein [Aliiglaciecola sp.]|uniref:2Fe-2S iron-sulfur cluster-binding protein n=1 Tax=Aliiglaciecola sp. TaxID=1872441 RepID=UPI0032991267
MKISTQNGIIFQQKSGQTILDASIEAGYPINHSCRSGRCGFCKVKLQSGKSHAYRSQQLSQQEIDDNWILTCCHTAVSDIQIDAGSLQQVTVPKVCSIPCAIDALEFISPAVLKVTLQLPLIVRFTFLAGQYVDLTQAGGSSGRYYLTKLKDKNQPQKIELHVLADKHDPMNQYWFTQAKVADLLTLEGPKGTFFLRDVSQRHVIIVVYEREIPAVQSMLDTLEALPKDMQAASVTLIWQGRTEADFYQNIITAIDEFEFIQTLPNSGSLLSGQLGGVQDIILNRYPDLTKVQVYACGPERCLEQLRKKLLLHKFDPQNYFSQGSFSNSVY